jgi:hypothetical protein
MGARYTEMLGKTGDIAMVVRFETHRADVTDYAVVLAIGPEGRRRTVRVYDGAHGRNEMHRYGRRRGRQSAVVVHGGTLGEGMRWAIEQIKRGYEEMIDGWRRT